MVEARIFEIPKDEYEVMAQLLAAVPATWSVSFGGFDAPEELIASGMVVRDTGYQLGEFYAIRPTVIGRSYPNPREIVKPDLVALIGEHKLPGFINFHEAPDRRYYTLEDVKRIAMALLRKGYRGALHFRSRYTQLVGYPESCFFHFRRWEGQFSIEWRTCLGVKRELPPCLEIEWDPENGGREENVGPILSVCRSLGLREITPQLTLS